MEKIRAEILRRLDAAEVTKFETFTCRSPIPALECASGLNLSVQASRNHYCSPRSDKGPWSAVEVGFPSQKIEAPLPYAEEPENPCGTVYSCVPLNLIVSIVVDNGGLKYEEPSHA